MFILVSFHTACGNSVVKHAVAETLQQLHKLWPTAC